MTDTDRYVCIIYVYISDKHSHTHIYIYMGVYMLITNTDMSVSQPVANLNPGLLNYSYSVGTEKKLSSRGKYEIQYTE